MNAATAPSPRTATGLKPKFTPVTRSFLRSQIDPKLGWFLMMLEDLAMDRTTGFADTWGIVYDADLRPTFGSDDTIGRLWAQAENEDQPGGPFLKRIRNTKGARIGFIWLRRPTDRPVATPDTWAQAQAQLEAAVAGRKGRARTLPMPSEESGTYRRFAGAPTADLRVHLPQICGESEGAPIRTARAVWIQRTRKKRRRHGRSRRRFHLHLRPRTRKGRMAPCPSARSSWNRFRPPLHPLMLSPRIRRWPPRRRPSWRSTRPS